VRLSRMALQARASFVPVTRRVRESIGISLVAVFIVLAVAPVAVVVATALYQLDQQARTQVTNQLQSIADIKSNQIVDWIADNQNVLKQFLANSTFDATLLQSLQGGEQQTAANQTLSQFLAEQYKAQTDFTEFFLYDMQGKILVSTADRQVGKIVTAEPYYKASLANSYVQPPYYEVGAGDLNMMVSSPIANAQGDTVGVLAGRLNLDTLSAIMTQRSGLGNTGETYLVSLESNYLVTASRFPGYPLTQAYHSQAIDSALAGKDGAGDYLDYRNTRVIGVYRWLPGVQVGLVAEIDETEALSTVNLVRTFSLELAAGALLVAILLGIAITVSLTRPIVALTHTAIAVAGGNYSQRVTVNSRNEIGQLATTFNSMTDRLVQTIEELNRRIEEIRQAKEAARAKDVFLATMSHELRTPLNAIIGFLGLMDMNMEGDLTPRLRHMVERTRANAERLLALINDILEISRIEAGRLELVRDEIPIREVIEKLRAQTSVLAERKGLEFTVQIAEDVPSILYADQEALTKIVSNLLSNAFKFTSKGQVSLKVSRSDQSVQIEVSDTGIGIPSHTHEVIFESFRQVDQSSARGYGGSGLGLSIVHQLCAAMQGSVRVRSATGEG